MVSIFDESSDEDEYYHHYDAYRDPIEYCKYGYRINYKSKWCCNKCFAESKYQKPEWSDIFKCEIVEMNDDWKILKLNPPKTQSEIKKQFYRLAKIYHPDKGGCKEDFIKLKSSYENLCILQ
jgi:hypothetical protein|tara:strand:+ start:47 stop:412 length:366 start_codon:yes stop_codon:yes gene_type:complete